MKTKHIISLFFALFFISCENDKLETPVAEYSIQYFDALKNVWTTLEKPYRIKLSENKKIRVLSENRSEHNAFYMGDTVKSSGVWIKHVYSPIPNKLYQGLALVFDNNIKKGLVGLNDVNGKLLYTKAGVYKVTFVATEVANYGNEMAIDVNNNDSIVVLK